MSRNTWSLIKQSKGFYVNTYRRVGTIILISTAINLLLGVGIYFAHYSQPEHAFYATSGENAPVQLTPMDAPNNSSTALLAPDEIEPNEENKVILQ